MSTVYVCPKCGERTPVYRNPAPTVDIVIYSPGRGVVLVERKNPPLGWALPGGFVEYGESLEEAACREAAEETGLTVVLNGVIGVYSSPGRDPRQHTITTAFFASPLANRDPDGGDDAAAARFFPLDALPPLVFDHARILQDFIMIKEGTAGCAKPEPGRSVACSLRPAERMPYA